MSASDSYLQSLYTAAGVRSVRKHGYITRERLRFAITIGEIVADFAVCTVATWVVCVSHVHLLRDLHAAYRSSTLSAGMLCGLFVVLLSLRERVYGGSGGLLQVRETERVLRVSTVSVLLLLATDMCLKLNIPLIGILLAFGLLPLSLLLEKKLLASILRLLYRHSIGIERAVVYGDLDTARHVASTLQQSPRLALCPVSVVAGNVATDITTLPEFGYRGSGTIPLQRGPLSSLLLQSLRCDLLIVALPHLSKDVLQELSVVAKQAKCVVALLSVLPEAEMYTAASIDIDGMVAVALADAPERLSYRVTKRFVDIILSSLLLVILSPLMLAVAVSIRLNSKGPAFFMQDRVGRNGELFKILKFRSMYTSAPRYERSPATATDPRITGIGRLLRRASLDELPQLINVLLGDMSLVGPRPEMPFVVEEHSRRSRQRVKVLPGITGLWQLSADRSFPIHQNIQYDLYYIRNRNIFMDLAILFHTLFFAIGGGI
jgi:exopolysaccharide biosynthesis polyprenyl glycosylphosphotransferase